MNQYEVTVSNTNLHKPKKHRSCPTFSQRHQSSKNFKHNG